VYYIVPIVNVDGAALVQKEFEKTGLVIKKRKNMSPNATYSTKGYTCADEDSGVDLNRNYAVDFGVAEKTQVGVVSSETQALAEVFGDKKLTENMFEDDCGDPCSECYRGPAAFSEPETRALRDFISAHKT
jgi:hypothetical protein